MFVLMHEAFHATLEILCGLYSEPLNPTGPHEQFALYARVCCSHHYGRVLRYGNG